MLNSRELVISPNPQTFHKIIGKEYPNIYVLYLQTKVIESKTPEELLIEILKKNK